MVRELLVGRVDVWLLCSGCGSSRTLLGRLNASRDSQFLPGAGTLIVSIRNPNKASRSYVAGGIVDVDP